MTATDELRRLLDERGVSKVNVESIDGSYWGVRWFEGVANAEWRENDEHTELLVINATPEQAIAATLGAGTCRWEYPQGVNGWLGYTVCSSCGERFDECVTDVAHYCPNCGRKIES